MPKIVEGEGILLIGVKNLSEGKEYELFESAKQIMSETNKVKFLPEQEYRLMQKGISKEYLYGNHVPDSILSIIAFETNSRYILNVEVLNSKKGGTFGSYTPLELDRYSSHYHQESETNSSNLIFKLFDTEGEGKFTENKYQVTANINPLVIKEGNGETRINPTTELTSITKAFEKGIKQLRKGLIKNH